jgi:hypothetical protein
MNHLGEEGYMRMARETQDCANKIKATIRSIDGIAVNGNPVGPVFSFRSDGKMDIFQLGDELTNRGWHLDRQMTPASLHFTVSHGNVAYVDEFIADLKASVEKLTAVNVGNIGASIKQSILNQATKILPEKWIRSMFNSSLSKINDENAEVKTAPLYGLMGQLSGSGTMEEMVLDLLDAMHTTDKKD